MRSHAREFEIDRRAALELGGDPPRWLVALTRHDLVLEDLPLTDRLLCRSVVSLLPRGGLNFGVISNARTSGQLTAPLLSASIDPSHASVMESMLGQLRPPTEEDLPALWQMWADQVTGPAWRGRGSVPSWQEFPAALWEGVDSQFVVTGDDGRVAGLVCSYGWSREQQWVHLAIVGAREARGHAHVLRATVAFLWKLVQDRPIRKVIFETPSYNEWLLDGLPIRGPHARLVDHVYARGRWWDSLLVELWRDDIVDTLRPLTWPSAEMLSAICESRFHG